MKILTRDNKHVKFIERSGVLNFNASCNNKAGINHMLNKGMSDLLNLDYIYKTVDAKMEGEIIIPMYPKKMTFGGFSIRTIRINDMAKPIIQFK